MRYLLIIFVLSLWSCSGDEDISPAASEVGGNGAWAIPEEEVVNDMSAMDRIPSVDTPKFIPAKDYDALVDESRVFVYKSGGVVKIYPKGPLSSHEIVNDKTLGVAHAITYCPITESGINWNRTIDGKETEFGVSGMLYQANLMPYDRNSGSIWSQMLLKGVHGEHIHKEAEVLPLLETTWKTARSYFPESKVLLTHDTTTCEDCQPKNILASPGDLVYGVPGAKQTPLIEFSAFNDSISIFKSRFLNRTHLLVGSQNLQFIVAFRLDNDMRDRTFVPVNNHQQAVVKDENGNFYNLFGEVVSGPESGVRLEMADGFMAKYFAWQDFYPDHYFIK